MKVYVPTPLRSYTSQKGLVEAVGPTLGELLWDLDHRFPGFRFRIITEQDEIREHIKLFVNQEQVHELSLALAPRDEVHIICALSGE